jgi:hypothetical protein
MVALGAGIQAPAAGFPVLTTVNRCLLKGRGTRATHGGEAVNHGMGRLTVPQLHFFSALVAGEFAPEDAGEFFRPFAKNNFRNSDKKTVATV